MSLSINVKIGLANSLVVVLDHVDCSLRNHQTNQEKEKIITKKKGSYDNQFKAEQLWVICISPVAHQLTGRPQNSCKCGYLTVAWHSFSAPWAALNVSFDVWGSVLFSLSFTLTFSVCPKHVSDTYEAAAELPQIAAWGFTESQTSCFSLNTPGHELWLHSLCFMSSSAKANCPVHDRRGLRWSQTGI